MAENPLLPNAELRALLDLTRRCAKLDAAAVRKAANQPGKRAVRPRLPASREALLAGTAIQLQMGDLLVTEPGDTTAASLSPAEGGTAPVALVPDAAPTSSRLALSVAMAAALRTTNSDRLVLYYLRAGAPQSAWAESLAWAQERLLPLIVVCGDARGPEAFRPEQRAPAETFAWEAVRKTTVKLKLPVLTVDGEDAVAVYRAMQESVLRARVGAGPAVLWAMLPSARDIQAGRPSGQAPVKRLERYLKARKISY